MILMRVDWNWAAAQAEIEHMREIAPVDAAALRAPLTEFLTIRGRNDEALNIAYRYVARDPLNVIALDDLVSSQFDAERFEECAATLHKLIELSPTYAGAHARLGLAQLYLDKKAQAFAEIHNETDEDWKLWASAMVYWAMDRRSESDVALRAYTEKHAGDDAYGIALIHAYRHELDEAFQWLDRAYDLHDAQMPYLKGVLWVRNLRGDPRFNALLRKMKLPET